jgi:hypothetical protein
MEFDGKTFCGKFASDGSTFAVAAQGNWISPLIIDGGVIITKRIDGIIDEKVRVYETAQWKLIREINVADMV